MLAVLVLKREGLREFAQLPRPYFLWKRRLLRKRHNRVHIKLTKQIDTFPVKIGSILKFTDIRFKES